MNESDMFNQSESAQFENFVGTQAEDLDAAG